MSDDQSENHADLAFHHCSFVFEFCQQQHNAKRELSASNGL